jgi:hypothetical protein
MGVGQKILTNDKYVYFDMELPIYRAKKGGAKMIKINNNYYNINNSEAIKKIREEYIKSKISEELNEDDYVMI